MERAQVGIVLLKIVDKRESDAAREDFHFAQVDCAANGDLCKQNEVKYYPSLFLYVQGNRVEEYTGKRTPDDLSIYVDDNMPSKVVWIKDTDGKYQKKQREGALLDDKAQHENEREDETKAEPTKQDDQDDDYEDTLNAHENKQEGEPDTKQEHKLANVIDEPDTDEDLEELVLDAPKADLSKPNNLETEPEKAKQPAAPGFVQQARNTEAKKSDLPMPDGQVHVLKPHEVATFKDEEGKPAFVKYYAPWCGHCKALAPKWADMATSLAGSVHVYEMDCDAPENKRTCRDEGVKAYPKLIFYNKGASVEYNGKRDVATMKAFALKAISATAIKPLANEYELKRAAAEEPVIILFLHSSETSKEDQNLATSAAKTLIGGAPFYTSTSLDLYHLFNLTPSKPYLLSFKDGSLVPANMFSLDAQDMQSALALPSSTDAAVNAISRKNPVQAKFDLVKQWLRSAKLPTLTELSGATFNDLMPKEGDPPLVGLAVLSRKGLPDQQFEQAKSKMTRLAKEWQSRRTVKTREKDSIENVGRDVVWSWVDGDKWAGWVRKMYGVKMGGLNGPELVIVDPKNLNYWKSTSTGQSLSFEPEQVFELVEQGIYTHSVKPQSSLSKIDKLSATVANLPKSGLTKANQHPIMTGVVIVTSWVLLFLVVKKCCGGSGSAEEGYARVNGNSKKD
ncbi:hypothetical protein OIV83_005081 [Microbotryomycetes sp. JL201]|nr:hypothetical protein OIV83_005081 [Microbotryomycetes sp. JL201]